MASRPTGPFLLALAATALLLTTLPAVSGSEAPVPDAVALLHKSLRLYGEAQTLQVKARMVVKIEPPERRVIRIGRWANNRTVGLVESGAWVAQRDYRLVRDQAYRLRHAEYGMDGECLLRIPAGRFLREYWNPRDVPPDLIAASLGQVIRYQNGTRDLVDQGHNEPAINLPAYLFLFSGRDSFFDPQTAVRHPQAAKGGQELVSLRVQARHTILRAPPEPGGFKKPVKKFRFGKGEWIIRLNPANSQIYQVDVHEEWPSLRPGTPDGVVDLRETYTDQLLNERLTFEDFILEPPDPVPAADLKGRDAGIGKDWEPQAKPEGTLAGNQEREP